MKPKAAMFDSHIFDALLENPELIHKLPSEIKYYATNIQYGEIKKIPCIDRRIKIESIFNMVINEKTQSVNEQWFSFGHSSFGHARFPSAREIKITNDYPNHIKDALIFLTTEQHDSMILVTNDKDGIFTPNKRKKHSILILFLEELIDLYGH